MKTLQTIISLTLIIKIFSVSLPYAQDTRTLLPLDAKDFQCLKSVDCIKNSESLKEKGWSFIFDDTVENFPQELTAKMDGENVSFFAIYNKEGDLIRSEYKRKNMSLPTSLFAYLADNSQDGWILTGTQMVMYNFDESTVTYEVFLQNGSSSESMNFDIAFIEALTKDEIILLAP
ncbi:MAG: hypothetical protein EA360_00680 [Balneolaceae bacterium]|nr:MAG: hypothetical protein EA360_00680 [Balneolaceae bacterium]